MQRNNVGVASPLWYEPKKVHFLEQQMVYCERCISIGRRWIGH
jgi:hypothetical protein